MCKQVATSRPMVTPTVRCCKRAAAGATPSSWKKSPRITRARHTRTTRHDPRPASSTRSPTRQWPSQSRPAHSRSDRDTHRDQRQQAAPTVYSSSRSRIWPLRSMPTLQRLLRPLPPPLLSKVCFGFSVSCCCFGCIYYQGFSLLNQDLNKIDWLLFLIEWCTNFDKKLS